MPEGSQNNVIVPYEKATFGELYKRPIQIERPPLPVSQLFEAHVPEQVKQLVTICRNEDMPVYLRGSSVNYLLSGRTDPPKDWDLLIGGKNSEVYEACLKNFGPRLKIKPKRYSHLEADFGGVWYCQFDDIDIDYRTLGRISTDTEDQVLLNAVSLKDGWIPFASLIYDFQNQQILSPTGSLDAFREGKLEVCPPMFPYDSDKYFDNQVHLAFSYFPKLYSSWPNAQLTDRQMERVKAIFDNNSEPIGRYREHPSERLWSLFRILIGQNPARSFNYLETTGGINWILTEESSKENLKNNTGDYLEFQSTENHNERVLTFLNAISENDRLKIIKIAQNGISSFREETGDQSIKNLFSFLQKIQR